MLGKQPPVGRPGILHGRRKGVLGRQAIVGRKDARGGGVGQARRNCGVRGRRAGDVAATVQIQDDAIGHRVGRGDPLAAEVEELDAAAGCARRIAEPRHAIERCADLGGAADLAAGRAQGHHLDDTGVRQRPIRHARAVPRAVGQRAIAGARNEPVYGKIGIGFFGDATHWFLEHSLILAKRLA